MNEQEKETTENYDEKTFWKKWHELDSRNRMKTLEKTFIVKELAKTLPTEMSEKHKLLSCSMLLNSYFEDLLNFCITELTEPQEKPQTEECGNELRKHDTHRSAEEKNERKETNRTNGHFKRLPHTISRR